jgi:hypothetical protein
VFQAFWLLENAWDDVSLLWVMSRFHTTLWVHTCLSFLSVWLSMNHLFGFSIAQHQQCRGLCNKLLCVHCWLPYACLSQKFSTQSPYGNAKCDFWFANTVFKIWLFMNSVCCDIYFLHFWWIPMNLDQEHEIKPKNKNILAMYLRVHVPHYWT